MRRRRLPVRLRLVAGFAGAMLLLLTAAGAFVYWRVQYALDHRLDEDLRAQTDDLRQAAAHLTPGAALASLRDEAREAQLLRADGTLLASGSGIPSGDALVSSAQARRASRETLEIGRGYLFSKPGRHLRILAVPVHGDTPAAVAVTAVRLDQRDEALRELLAQLAIANLLALAVASFVGYRFAHAALDPVERYRAQAERITHGETAVRLEVPPGPPDEITRLGATLNAMIDALERSAERQQQFIDDTSHELRTPLTALSAEIDLALRKPRTVREHEATLRRLAADTAALLGLAEALLTLGTLGSATPNAQDIPAKTLLDAAARRARGQLDTSSPRTVAVRSADDLLVRGDGVLLDRALGNLVDNAVRHGAGDITLSAFGDGARHLSVIAVHDEGRVDPAFLDHAAERFRQHESSRSGPGVGLGLSLVDAIAVAHDGQLRICSAGRHHARSTRAAELAQVPCTHAEVGTTITLLLAGSP